MCILCANKATLYLHTVRMYFALKGKIHAHSNNTYLKISIAAAKQVLRSSKTGAAKQQNRCCEAAIWAGNWAQIRPVINTKY